MYLNLTSLSVIFFAIFFQLFGNSQVIARTVVTQRPIYSNYNSRPNIISPNTIRHSYVNPRHNFHNPNRNIYRTYPQNYRAFPDLNALEKYSMNKVYSRDSDLERLQRLEMQTFGAVQSGDITSRYENVRGAILSRPKQNYKTSLLRNIGNYFSGQMTGFTPSFSNDPFFTSSNFSSTPYPTSYGNRSFTEYKSPFGSGYQINDFGTSSGCGVKILD